ncbi:MAG: DUF4294 domain-containing protein [Flavobacteriales bacterium]|nr:DUF4294 domain-containing protein [Flavobacteriales bacterium]
MSMLRAFLLSAFLLATAFVTRVRAQSAGPNTVFKAVVMDGDTIPSVDLHEAVVEGRWTPKDRREAARYDRLTRNVLKVYPYAHVTRELLSEYQRDLTLIRRTGDQDLYVKLAEAELRAEFEAEVKDLTGSQGRVLVKLIDRETGRTSYDLVKQLRGGFTAFIWQGMARLFGQDLRSTYDADGEDRMIEVVVQRIERGDLVAAVRAARTASAQARLTKRKARLYKRYGIESPQADL